MNEIISLIAETRTVNDYGDLVSTVTKRAVFAKPLSVGQSEFYQAAAVGLRPEIKFVLSDYLDYQGEKKLEYKGFGETAAAEYSIIRTYRNGNQLEIVCRRGVD